MAVHTQGSKNELEDMENDVDGDEPVDGDAEVDKSGNYDDTVSKITSGFSFHSFYFFVHFALRTSEVIFP